MIRRDVGSDWLLIDQADHAIVAGRLAAHVGGRRFARVIARRASILAAVESHDDGWRAHDASPTLDSRGRPLDVFDAPYTVALPAWSASTAAAAESGGPYAGLLVSLHVLALSARAASSGSTFNMADPQVLFAVNQFQHREIERQEALREAVGLPTDIPLTHGLAEPGLSVDDDHLVYAALLLRAMDVVSLAMCCSRPPYDHTGDVRATPTASVKRLSVVRDVGGVLRVRPWPFDVAQLSLSHSLPPSPRTTVRRRSRLQSRVRRRTGGALVRGATGMTEFAWHSEFARRCSVPRPDSWL